MPQCKRPVAAVFGGSRCFCVLAGRAFLAVSDPNKPKRPASAYMRWMGDVRGRLKSELEKANSGDKIGMPQVAKRAGELWKTEVDGQTTATARACDTHTPMARSQG